MTKAAKLAHQACLPDDASPAAIPTMFDSAMPTLKKRSGNFLAKCSVRVELFTSPSTTTSAGSAAPSCASARPKASRVDLPSFMTISPDAHCDCCSRIANRRQRPLDSPECGERGGRRVQNANDE